ncbi:MAG: type II toxin-antitoxin system RelE/ParE family toxin [Bacteroidales bacterium]|nr:type II toxin-antitoxin system RelE/ParE family toxin [Bacteroidales bacterium]
MKIVWAKQASKSAKEIALYINKSFGTKAKHEFLSAINDMIKKLEQNPLIGKLDPYMEGFAVEYRCVFVQRLSKVVYYVDGNKVTIVAFTDARRDPINIASQILQN